MADYTLPDLPYDYAALEPHVSAEIMELHHDKHHAAYVTGANQTLEKLAAARDKDDFGAVVGLEKTLAFHISGHVLHSIFWKNLSPDGGDKPDGASRRGHRRELRLVRQVQGAPHPGHLHHPGLRLGRAGLRAAGRSAHRRAGLRPPEQRRERSVPLLVFDAWEHAFYLQYKNVKADFFAALWNIVNWSDVAARLDKAKGLSL